MPTSRPETEASDGPKTETSEGQLSLRVWLADGEERSGLGAVL